MKKKQETKNAQNRTKIAQYNAHCGGGLPFALNPQFLHSETEG